MKLILYRDINFLGGLSYVDFGKLKFRKNPFFSIDVFLWIYKGPVQRDKNGNKKNFWWKAFWGKISNENLIFRIFNYDEKPSV